MPQTLQCPHCEGTVGVAEDDLGAHLTCPHCDRDFLAPQLTSRLTSHQVSSEDEDWLNLDEKPKTEQLPVDSPAAEAEPAAPGSTSFDTWDLPDFVDDGPPVVAAAKAQESVTEFADEFVDEFRITCRTCGTPTYVKAKQAGRTIRCVDCHSDIKVPPPPKRPKAKPQPPSGPQQALPLQKSEQAVQRRDPFKKSADELLRKAEAASVEAPPPNYDTPDVKEWLLGIFSIFLDSGVLVHWILFSVMASLPATIALRSEHPILIAGLFPWGIFLGSLVAASGLAILKSVANEEESVQDWPAFSPFSWLGQLLLVSAAAGIAIVPVAILGFLTGPSLLVLLAGMFAVYLVFPFVLLSMMDMGNVLQPFSAEVARSVTDSQEAWGGLYFSSAILFAALFLLIVSMNGLAGHSGIAISLTASIAVVFIYFGMIGRLASAIGQADDESGGSAEE